MPVVKQIIDDYKLPAIDMRKREVTDLKDFLINENSQGYLKVRVEATHTGYINNNFYNYDREHARVAAETFTSPISKPVLTFHDEHQLPIGRVDDYDFQDIDESGKEENGALFLDLIIVDRQAIDLIKSGSLSGVSVRSVPKSVTCSICDAELTDEENECIHDRGSLYDEQICSWNVKTGRYLEVSYVNVPADTKARTVSYEFTDEDPGKLPDYKDEIAEVKALTDAETEIVEDTETEEEFTDEEKEALDSIYADMLSEFALMYNEGVLTDEEYLQAGQVFVEDAKLSAAQRKKLSKSVFCGPDRSFPVNDCAHATAALRLLGRSKYSDSTKSKIRGCVNRRKKTLKCGGTNDDAVSLDMKAIQDAVDGMSDDGGVALLQILADAGLTDKKVDDTPDTDGNMSKEVLDEKYISKDKVADSYVEKSKYEEAVKGLTKATADAIKQYIKTLVKYTALAATIADTVENGDGTKLFDIDTYTLMLEEYGGKEEQEILDEGKKIVSDVLAGIAFAIDNSEQSRTKGISKEKKVLDELKKDPEAEAAAYRKRANHRAYILARIPKRNQE